MGRYFSKSVRILLAIITLALGGLIYYTYRTDTLIMFNWAYRLGLENFITYIRDFNSASKPSDFIIYCLPNALWATSYLIAIDTLVNVEDHKLEWGLFLPIIATILETLQAFNIIPGTFDLLDIICFITPAIIYLAYYKITYYAKNY